jgi:hypothetical protein
MPYVNVKITRDDIQRVRDGSSSRREYISRQI